VAASKSTVERVLEVILKHVPKETALKILEELMTVPGNKSFAIPSSGCTTVPVNDDRDDPLGGHPWRPSRPRRSEIRRTARWRTRGHGGGRLRCICVQPPAKRQVRPGWLRLCRRLRSREISAPTPTLSAHPPMARWSRFLAPGPGSRV
jgi:hypothetical protein